MIIWSNLWGTNEQSEWYTPMQFELLNNEKSVLLNALVEQWEISKELT